MTPPAAARTRLLGADLRALTRAATAVARAGRGIFGSLAVGVPGRPRAPKKVLEPARCHALERRITAVFS